VKKRAFSLLSPPHKLNFSKVSIFEFDKRRLYRFDKNKQNNKENKMKYLLLIYSNEAEGAKMTPEEQQANMDKYFAFTKELNESGNNLGGEALQPTSSATSVRVKDGKTIASDGPFAETKEQLGGFYMINADNLDDAIQWAAKIPGAHHGTIEVRPIWEFE
jgi:hypothetical protein